MLLIDDFFYISLVHVYYCKNILKYFFNIFFIIDIIVLKLSKKYKINQFNIFSQYKYF